MQKDEFIKLVRRMLLEEVRRVDLAFPSVNSLQESEPLVQSKPKQLSDTSKLELVGDPVDEINLNQMTGKAGSYGEPATALAVKAGAKKGGKDAI